MSVIAVKVWPDEIIIWSDSQVSTHANKEIKDEKPIKLFEVGEIIFGSVWLLAEAQLMRLYLQERQPQRLHEEIDYVRFFNDFEKRCDNHTNGTYKETENAYIFVAFGKAFVCDCYNIYEVTTFDAVWSGYDKALMGLDLGFDVETTLKTVCKYDLYCHEPVITHSRKRSW